jgi:hypothetical protein
MVCKLNECLYGLKQPPMLGTTILLHIFSPWILLRPSQKPPFSFTSVAVTLYTSSCTLMILCSLLLPQACYTRSLPLFSMGLHWKIWALFINFQGLLLSVVWMAYSSATYVHPGYPGARWNASHARDSCTHRPRSMAMVPLSVIPLPAAVLPTLFSISPSPDPKSCMLSNMFVFRCMIPGNHTWPLSSGSFGTSRYCRLRAPSLALLYTWASRLNVDWARCRDNHRSTSVYVVFLGPTSSLGLLNVSPWSPALVLRRSTGLLLMRWLRRVSSPLGAPQPPN